MNDSVSRESADEALCRAPLRDGLALTTLALVARFAVVLWAWSRIPPTADGTFYDTIARRIAKGQGYTWLWPNGTVTYAAHYPVGYPALVAFGYRFFESEPGVAMALNAILGAVAVLAVHRFVARGGTRKQAFVASLIVALHPGLVSYTPALMTEGVTSSLLAVSLWAFVRTVEARGAKRVFSACLLGLVIALATYVRPQCIVLAPLLGLYVPLRESDSVKAWLTRALLPAVVASTVALAVIAPWSARNCDKMGRCALVSVNGGWNLLIGTDPEAHGSWAEVKVPLACRAVFDEAEKDACFGREAQKIILAAPGSWLALAPQKLAATFDYAGAGPWYLHAASPSAFSQTAKVALGALEVLFERLVLVGCIVAVARRLWRRASRVDRAFAVVVTASGLSLLTVHAYLAVLGVVLGLGALLFRREVRGIGARFLPPVFGAAFLSIGSTALIHAVFFGAGRYSLVVFPVFSALAPFAFGATAEGDIETPPLGSFDTSAAPRAS